MTIIIRITIGRTCLTSFLRLGFGRTGSSHSDAGFAGGGRGRATIGGGDAGVMRHSDDSSGVSAGMKKELPHWPQRVRLPIAPSPAFILWLHCGQEKRSMASLALHLNGATAGHSVFDRPQLEYAV